MNSEPIVRAQQELITNIEYTGVEVMLADLTI
jgi:hypothetical protein